MKYLTENAEEKIKEMDFCIIIGADNDHAKIDIEDVIETYLEDCCELKEKPNSEIEIELFKYFPFGEYKRGLILEDLIERMDDYHNEEATSLNEFPDEVFELEKRLYEAVTKNYQRYFGEIFCTIKIDISDEIKEWEGGFEDVK